MKYLRRNAIIQFVIGSIIITIVGCSSGTQMMHAPTASGVLLDTVKAGRFDTGKMWTFDHPPVDYFQESYGFKPTQQWLDNVRMSALRFANYCSASFVSADGLVMTNHHCARNSVEQVSKENENLLTNGFIAQTMAEERKVPGLYVDQLVKIEDVTKRIQSAIEGGKTDEEKSTNKRKAISEVEKEYAKQTGLRCNVVTLFNGGQYSIYCYKRYDDVRLVFAPELTLGFFGGDPDNFTYPRYTFDCSFFRVYQDSVTPLKPEHYFPFSENGARAGEPVFVVGNPGSSSRLLTVAQLEYRRDYSHPFTLRFLENRMAIIQKETKIHPEKKEELINQYFNLSNSQKAYAGQIDGLHDPILMQRKKDFEKNFRAAIEAKPELRAKYGSVWDNITETRREASRLFAERNGLGSGGGFRSQLYGLAQNIVEYAYQATLEDQKRDALYKGMGFDAMMNRLKLNTPFDADLEMMYLETQLRESKTLLGAEDPFITFAFKGNDPAEAARSFVKGTMLTDSVQLKSLIDGGWDAVQKSNDPLIVLAREAAPRLRSAQAKFREIQPREEVNVNLLGKALFEVYGNSIPPDATFTLRIADGVVKGYEYNGTIAPPYTTFYGMYDRHYSSNGDESWELPERWINYSKDFDLNTPLNFVATCDIIGGNSGSPMINKQGNVVGLVFDGNIESLPGDFIFDDTKNRTVAVHSKGMLEGLKDIYHADRLVKELTGK